MIRMSTDPPLTPLGVLLEEARGRRSTRSVAKAADISEGWWRQVVTGVQKHGEGITSPANPKASTVVAMAKAVDADVDDALRLAGFSDEVRQTYASSDQPGYVARLDTIAGLPDDLYELLREVLMRFDSGNATLREELDKRTDPK